MKAEYRKRTNEIIQGERVYQSIPLDIFYQANALDNDNPMRADKLGTIIASDDVVYLDGEPCKLSTLTFVMEEV
jgi:hypothetical protein